MGKKSNKNIGFTLIEIMVAVSLFMAVALVATSILLTIMNASQRANAIRLIIDNLNFAMDSMSYKLKFGSDYTVLSSGGGITNNIIQFIEPDQSKSTYCLPPGDTAIRRCNTAGNTWQTCSNSCQAITAPEINVTRLVFYKNCILDGSICSNPTKYTPFPLVIIEMTATSSIRGRSVDFSIKTSVSGNKTGIGK